MTAAPAQKPAAQTKLGYRLRLLAEKDEHATIAGSLLNAANQLDNTARAMGVRGGKIKTLGAFHTAAAWYERATGTRYRA